jgi:hypothetical protein
LVRLRDWKPLAHDVLQVDQPEPQEPTPQLIGHAKVLHDCVSASCGHALPPNTGCTCVRERDCEPVPHDLVHVDQSPNVGWTLQSWGHE